MAIRQGQATKEAIRLAAVFGPLFNLTLEAMRQPASQGSLFNLTEEAQQELKQRVGKHQSDVEINANPAVKAEGGSLTADVELERRTIGVSMSSSAWEVEMAINAAEAEPKSATEIARRLAPGACRNPMVENLTTQAAEG